MTHNKNKFMYGAISGIVEVTLTHPIDVIKTSVQYGQPVLKYNLYKGYIPRVVGIIPVRSVFWGSQSVISNVVPDNNYKYILSGTVSGALQTTVDTPVEVLKVNYITKSKTISLYQGVIPNLLRNCVYGAVITNFVTCKQTDNPLEYFIRGSTAGVLCSVVTQPLDCIKTQQQAHNHNLKTVCSNITLKQLFSGTVSGAILSFFTLGVGSTVFMMATQSHQTEHQN